MGATVTSVPATAPTARVGMIGGGQLARMTQRAAIDLGVELVVLDPDAHAVAVRAGALPLVGRPDSLEDLARLARSCQVVTFDHERVPPRHLRALEDAGADVRPSPSAKVLAQDKLTSRRVIGGVHGFPVPDFAGASTLEEVRRFGARQGWPIVMKARRGGYDGRGVEVVDGPAGARSVLGRGGEWVLEPLLDLDAELAVLVARSAGGEVAVYPPARTVQSEGMCREIHAPAPVEPSVGWRAAELAGAIAESIGATGLLAVELFVTRAGELLVNELALRPHNSGHWTLEGAHTSQFEQHLRAILDWPLGRTGLTAPAVATVNVVGGDPGRSLAAALAVPGARVHLYAKKPRPGRKLGHVTAVGDDLGDALRRAREAAGILAEGGP